MNEKKPPVKKYSMGGVSCSVWENKYDDGGTSHSFSFQKTYKGQDGTIQNTNNFNKKDIGSLLLIVKKIAEKSVTVFDPSQKKSEYSQPQQQGNSTQPAPVKQNDDTDDIPF